MAEMQINETSQKLLSGLSEMPLRDLEAFISELNALVARKRAADSGKRSKVLMLKINQAVLPEHTMDRYVFLQEKMELEKISDEEYQELLSLVAQEEKLRNKRFQFIIELSQLRNISIGELMETLGLNTLPHA